MKNLYQATRGKIEVTCTVSYLPRDIEKMKLKATDHATIELLQQIKEAVTTELVLANYSQEINLMIVNHGRGMSQSLAVKRFLELSRPTLVEEMEAEILRTVNARRSI